MDYQEVKELIGIIEGTDFTRFSLHINGVEVEMERGGGADPETQSRQTAAQTAAQTAVQTAAQPAENAAAAEPVIRAAQPGGASENASERTSERASETAPERAQENPEGHYVTAPLVGTFYASPTPDAPAFVKAGDSVKKGDVLCIVEAMKFMNEITSEFDGTVAEILAKDQAMVEYGQPLFRIV